MTDKIKISRYMYNKLMDKSLYNSEDYLNNGLRDTINKELGISVEIIEDDYLPFTAMPNKDCKIDTTPRNRQERRHGRKI